MLLLHFGSFFLAVYQVRAEQIKLFIQCDELTHQFVFHLVGNQQRDAVEKRSARIAKFAA